MTPSDIRKMLAQSFTVGIEGVKASPEELALFAGQGLGGVILFARNIESPRQVWELNRSMQKAAGEAGNPPLFVMLDQEGGSVARLKEPFTCGPDMAELGAVGNADALKEHGGRMGQELLAAGFNWNLAPVVDVHAIPDGVMARRSLGSDPGLVGGLAAAYIQGLAQAGCLSCAKHFPGLGRTTLDTHTSRPQVDWSLDELERMELPPFRAAARAGVSGIMVSHAVFSALDPENPASLSATVIKEHLRGGLKYEGCVLSDDLEMGAVAASLQPDQAAVKAYLAGCDILLICHRPRYALKALDTLCEMAGKGGLSLEHIGAAAARIKTLKQGLSPGFPGYAALRDLLHLA
jgi:beta-N-acetylhexosaminidase